MRALVHSPVCSSMCVDNLDVCCGKLLAGYLGWPPINGMISVWLLGRVKCDKLSASFSSLKWFWKLQTMEAQKKIYWYHEMTISLHLKKDRGQCYQLLHLRTTLWCRDGEQMIQSFLNLSHNWFVTIFWISCTLWYEMLSPSAANVSTSDFFLVLGCTRSPIFRGRGGSLNLEECIKDPSHLCFVLTALNQSNWAKFVTTVSALVNAFSIIVSP